jgi:hypothetical protein
VQARQFREAIVVRRAARADAHVRDLTHGTRRLLERGGRDVDQVQMERRLRARERSHQRGELVAAAGTELDDQPRIGERADRHGITFEQALFSARHLVPRQAADRFEQRRSKRIVQIFRRQRLRRRREATADVGHQRRIDRLGGAGAFGGGRESGEGP